MKNKFHMITLLRNLFSREQAEHIMNETYCVLTIYQSNPELIMSPVHPQHF